MMGRLDHVDEALYEALTRRARTTRAERRSGEPELRPVAETVLHREARLLDNGHLDDWLSLFTEDGVYWVPINPAGGDPRAEVSIHLHDLRRLGDYIAKLRTGWAHSQMPQSRTRRLVANVDAWPGEAADTLDVASTVVIWEYRRTVGTEVPGGREMDVRPFAASCDYVLQADGAGWRIKLKIVNLVNSDAGFANLSFLL
jgi:benzoate/toluate 1,2-dioxygenase beta subunit